MAVRHHDRLRGVEHVAAGGVAQLERTRAIIHSQARRRARRTPPRIAGRRSAPGARRRRARDLSNDPGSAHGDSIPDRAAARKRFCRTAAAARSGSWPGRGLAVQSPTSSSGARGNARRGPESRRGLGDLAELGRRELEVAAAEVLSSRCGLSCRGSARSTGFCASSHAIATWRRRGLLAGDPLHEFDHRPVRLRFLGREARHGVPEVGSPERGWSSILPVKNPLPAGWNATRADVELAEHREDSRLRARGTTDELLALQAVTGCHCVSAADRLRAGLRQAEWRLALGDQILHGTGDVSIGTAGSTRCW